MDDAYFTIRTESRVEIKVKDSRFIGETRHVISLDQATDCLNATRKQEHAASHHCYAWIIGIDKQQQFKYSDDGEPSGTAGKPIYDVLAGAELTNSLLIVIRYFGGTKLGTGGLTHAYSDTAKAVLEASGKQEQFIKTKMVLRMAFPFYDRWLRLQQKLGATVTKADFGENVVIELEIRNSKIEELRRSYIELTAGKGEIDIVEG